MDITGTVTGTAAPKQETKSGLLRLVQPTALQVALYDEAGNQLTDGVDVLDGAYTLTYDTKNKAIAPAAACTLKVGFVGLSTTETTAGRRCTDWMYS